MKSTGIVRKVDELGRVVIPIELRRIFDIDVKDAIEILTDAESIVLRKYKPHMKCAVTGEVSNDNLIFGDGNVVLSKKGAQILLEEIEAKKLEG